MLPPFCIVPIQRDGANILATPSMDVAMCYKAHYSSLVTQKLIASNQNALPTATRLTRMVKPE